MARLCAVGEGCTHAILAHNHPSGSLKPSKEDIDITDRLYQCGLILNIPIHDHIILNMTTFITFKALELMAKIEKSLKFKPHYKIVEEMKAEADTSVCCKQRLGKKHLKRAEKMARKIKLLKWLKVCSLIKWT